MHLLTLALALVVDRAFGEADFLWKRIGHPVVWFGWLIGQADSRFNNGELSPYRKRRDGFLTIMVLMVLVAFAGGALHAMFKCLGWFGLIAEAQFASIFLAHKSLIDHVGAVATGLHEGGLEGGRRAVSHIVGRDPAMLDEAGVSRAAIESLAENFADGVVAPAFWYALGGLPGLFAYKMLNTADSMIGHMTDKHRDFGRAAAQIDDLANFLPARLSGLLICAAALVFGGIVAGLRGFATMMRDARLHRSPNSGWPEAAVAGSLDLALAGPRIYKGDVANEPMLNASGKRQAGFKDIIEAIDLINATLVLTVLLVLAAAILL